MADPTISAEEVEILSQEEAILAKQEQGENLETEETETLEKINSLKDDIKERFKDKESPEKTKEEIISLQAQKEHFRTKFGKSDQRVKDLEAEITGLKKKGSPKDPDDKDKRIDDIEFLIANREVTKGEFDFISAYARGKDISLEDALTSEDVKTWITASREKSGSDKKIPSPTSRSGSFIKDENVFKSDDTEDDTKKKFSKHLESFLGKKGIKSGV